MATDTILSDTTAPANDVTENQPSSPVSNSSREETRDTREKFKKATIDGLQDSTSDLRHSTDNDELRPESANGSTGHSRPSKKRSYEDLAKDSNDADKTASDSPEPKRTDHKRVRSVEVGHDSVNQSYTRHEGDKNNTVQEETDAEAQSAPGGPGILVEAPTQTEQSETSESTSATSKIPATSGFANTSSASPFGSSKSPIKATSTSAFSASGLSSFASSESSPFGAAPSGQSAFGGGGGLGFGSATKGFGSSSGFGSNATSSFSGTSSSTFGAPKPFGASSAFGAPKPFGSSGGFGGGAAPGTFGSGKPIGAGTKEDDDDEETNDDEDSASNANVVDEQDPRFHEQQVDTGEQGEEVLFTARARLYFFEGAWKERGTGVVKVNVRVSESDAAETTETTDPEAQKSQHKRKARLLMRADATHRVILNSPIFKGMRFGDSDGSTPTGKIMHLQSLENGKPIPLQIKIGKEDVLRDLYNHLLELEKEA